MYMYIYFFFSPARRGTACTNILVAKKPENWVGGISQTKSSLDDMSSYEMLSITDSTTT